MDANYGDSPKHETSETSETNDRNTKYPKYHTKKKDGPKHKMSETSETKSETILSARNLHPSNRENPKWALRPCYHPASRSQRCWRCRAHNQERKGVILMRDRAGLVRSGRGIARSWKRSRMRRAQSRCAVRPQNHRISVCRALGRVLAASLRSSKRGQR